jgi:ATP-dependent Clp protease ATP-binding subunit ClpA
MLARWRQRIADTRTMKQLFTLAEDAARGAGETKPGAEHLVLASLALPDGSARRTFERVGVDPDHFRTAIAEQHTAALRSIGVAPDDDVIDRALPELTGGIGPYRTEVSAQQLFQEATRTIHAERSHLTGAHIVLAATTQEHGTVARTLRYMGIDRDELAQAARAELATTHSQP